MQNEGLELAYDICFPKSPNFKELSNFSLEMANIPEKETLKIDTAEAGFFTPTTMIFFAKICRARSRKFSGETLVYTGLERHGYANNLGFSDALNPEGTPFPQGAFGGKAYIPLSGMFRDNLEQDRLGNYDNIGDVIEQKCIDISQIVNQTNNNEKLRSTVARSFCEIFRNCFEHGEANVVGYCAQYWPTKGKVEICIADRGIGVCNSLNESKHTKPKDDREALFYSLMPGISSKASIHKKKKSHQKSHWDNAGYGLFFAHRLFGQLGSFNIASRSHALEINRSKLLDYPTELEGTLVSMILDLSDMEAIENCLKGLSGMASKVKERLGVKSLNYTSVEAFISTGKF